MEINYVTIYLKELLYQFPIIIVTIVGIILAIAKWRKHSTVSLVTVITLVFFLAHTFISGILFLVLPSILYSMNSTTESQRLTSQIVSFISILIDAVIMTLLLVAALIKRNGQNPNLGGQHI